MRVTAAIEIENLEYRYGERAAVAGLNLTVQAGSIVGLLGPNGGGKSTTLAILATLRRPYAGRAVVAGHDVLSAPRAVRRSIGVVFQSPALDRKLTVRENLLHHGHLYGLWGSELRDRVRTTLQQVGLVDRADELVETLSGGLQRRAEIAKVLLHEPRVLLLDEPTTGLDPAARAALWEQLRRLRAERGCSVLMATHLFEDAEQCDRVAIIDQGRLVGAGTPAELKAQIGGEVLTLDCDHPNEVAAELRREVEGGEVTVGRGCVRIAHPQAHRLVPSLAERLGSRVRSLRLGQPTLADVFFRLTGHEFDNGA